MENTEESRSGFVERVGHSIAGNVQSWLPNPFLFAIVLTFIAYVMGVGLTDSGPMEMIKHWNAGFWNLLTFAMQMVFILVTGFVLAYHPLAQRLIRGLTRIPVSYTHLRAHETKANLVCRLLLEQ